MGIEQDFEMDNFVREFITDYDSYAACIRCGFHGSEALEKAKQYMDEPYVRQAIKKAESHRFSSTTCHEDKDSEEGVKDSLAMDFPPLSPEQEEQMIIAALIREAHYTGPGSSPSARVSALNTLIKIKGMDKPKEEKKEGGVTGGVMIVPVVATLDDWEKGAAQQQSELKKTVRD